MRESYTAHCAAVAMFILTSSGAVLTSAAPDESKGTGSQLREMNEHAARAWKQGRDKMLEILDLKKEQRELPHKAWVRRDRTDVDKEIDGLLDEVLEVLRVSNLTDFRAEYAKLNERIETLKGKMVHLREARMTADKEKTVLGFFRRTRNDYTEQIDKLDKEVNKLESKKADLVRKLQQEYAHMGIKLSLDQVKFYLSSISGRDIMALSAIFDNVRALNTQLEQLLKENRGEPEAARRYYGIHVVMIRAVAKAHEMVLDNIENKYLARIAELAKRNDAVREQTKKLLESATPKQRPILEANRKAQDTTDKVLDIYRSHLEKVQERLEKALKAIRARQEVAGNAYETITISSALAAEMQTALKDLATLREMHLPELIPFDNEAIEKKFSEITAALKQTD